MNTTIPTDQRKPFHKWLGGKRRLLQKLEPLFPVGWVDGAAPLYEPFMGGGAVFWAYGGRRPAFLQDANPHLIELWTALRDEPETFLSELAALARADSEDYFYALREKDRDPAGFARIPADARAARFFYILKVGYNGLYRVNAAGQCNTPWGDRDFTFDIGALRAAGRALRHRDCTITLGTDWASVFARAPADGFVFLDPPYVPLTTTVNFAAYTANGFSRKGTLQLLDDVLASPAPTMLCNHNVAWLRGEAYARGLWVTLVEAPRSIRPLAAKQAAEVVITNYEPRRPA